MKIVVKCNPDSFFIRSPKIDIDLAQFPLFLDACLREVPPLRDEGRGEGFVVSSAERLG
jgi:hypothetical protein